VFDNDGTLWCEKPMPIELGFILQRLVAMAEEDESLRKKQPWTAAYEQDYAWLGRAVDKHYAGDDSDLKVLMGGILQAYGGQTVEGSRPPPRPSRPARRALPRHLARPERLDPDEEPLHAAGDPGGFGQRGALRPAPRAQGRQAEGRRPQGERAGRACLLIGGAALPLLAALGRVTGLLESPVWATVLGVAGMLIALAASWVILRGAALASRRIRLATTAPMQTLWTTIGWCGKPPKNSTRTFVIVSITLTIGAWILVPILFAIALAT
jgi:hypothetical protein